MKIHSSCEIEDAVKLTIYVLFFSTVMVGVGIFTLGGEFEPDLTSYLFYNFISVLSATRFFIACMVRGLFCFFSAEKSGGEPLQQSFTSCLD